jgi:hypothetical protein
MRDPKPCNAKISPWLKGLAKEFHIFVGYVKRTMRTQCGQVQLTCVDRWREEIRVGKEGDGVESKAFRV